MFVKEPIWKREAMAPAFLMHSYDIGLFCFWLREKRKMDVCVWFKTSIIYNKEMKEKRSKNKQFPTEKSQFLFKIAFEVVFYCFFRHNHFSRSLSYMSDERAWHFLLFVCFACSTVLLRIFWIEFCAFVLFI